MLSKKYQIEYMLEFLNHLHTLSQHEDFLILDYRYYCFLASAIDFRSLLEP